MLIAGSTVLVAYSAAITWQLHAALNSSAEDALGLFGSVGSHEYPGPANVGSQA